jgi:hypothetical protein
VEGTRGIRNRRYDLCAGAVLGAAEHLLGAGTRHLTFILSVGQVPIPENCVQRVIAAQQVMDAETLVGASKGDGMPEAVGGQS